jgi:dTDP-4-dehydrorhamnose reductase
MVSKALVLGGRGMLGSAVVRRLKLSDLDLSATARVPATGTDPVQMRSFSVGDSTLSALLGGYGEGDFVINCIGIIKQRMNDRSVGDRLRAIEVNSAFPHYLSEFAESQGFRVIQIATDCVFTGKAGSYNESSEHDAGDVYGQSKSLGEVPGAQFLNLRCSIIGPEVDGCASLLGWLLSQRAEATINGFSDHIWNGLTTDAFARITAGLIESKSELSGTFHVVPADRVDKDQLSRLLLETFGRSDVSVVRTKTGNGVDRTLSTMFPDQNEALWRLGGYSEPPSIRALVSALSPT